MVLIAYKKIYESSLPHIRLALDSYMDQCKVHIKFVYENVIFIYDLHWIHIWDSAASYKICI